MRVEVVAFTARRRHARNVATRETALPGYPRRRANVPGHHEHIPLQFELGEPGVRQGQ